MTSSIDKKRKAEVLLKNEFSFDQSLFQKIYKNSITAKLTFYEPRYIEEKNQTFAYVKVTVAETLALNQLTLLPARNENHLEPLNRAFKSNPATHNVIPDLVALKDDLILLLLENICIDHRFHRLKFRFCDVDPTPTSGKLQLGSFASPTRVIEINIHPLAHYKSTALHEMAHALAYFMFRSPDDAQPSVYPFPAKNMDSKSKSADEKFNPAELKFRHCVSEDKKRLERLNIDKMRCDARRKKLSRYHQFQHQPLTQADLLDAFMGPRLSTFFSAIETNYETTIQEPVGLSEVFSFYMQYRGQCLEFAAANNIAPDRALHYIKNKLPMLHDYFETDIKRLMRNRLMYFMITYKMDLFQSNYFTAFPINSVHQDCRMAQLDTNKLFRGFWAENLSRMYFSLGHTGKLHPITANANATSEQADFVHGWRQHFTP